MSYQKPTYEEYLKATAFGRFRYRFGYLINLVAVLCFIVVIFYMISSGETIAKNPLVYGADKFSVTCECRNSQGDSFFVNGTNMWLPKTSSYIIGDFNLSLQN